MTAIDIDAIRKLADAATRGPWELVTDSCDCGGEYGCSHGTFPYALRLPEHRVSEQDRPCDPSDGFDSYRHKAEEFGDLTMETAEFIAAARTLVPALCDELEQTRAALTASRENAANLANEVGALKAELERMREQAYAQKPVIEAAQAWAEERELNGNVIKAEEALFDAVEQHWLMDLALTIAHDEHRCENCAPGYDCERGIYTPEVAG